MSMRVATARGADRAPTDRITPRPRLLFLCQTLPYPPDGGVAIRSYNVLRLLSRSFDVTAVCFYRSRDFATRREVDAAVASLSRFGHVEAFPIPQEHSRLRLAWDHLRSVASRRAYTVYAYESSVVTARLQALLNQIPFDLAHVDSLDLSAYLPMLDMPVICVHHNIESALLRRRSAAETSRARGAYIAHQADLLEKEERLWCERVALNVTVSENDRATLAQMGRSARATVIPNGVDVDQFQPIQREQSGIIFVGGHSWFPNRDGMTFFCNEVLPLLRERLPSETVRWVGRASQQVRREFERRYGLHMAGYVDDIRPYVAEAACFIVPLRVGGGTRLKILDAWAMGKAVVSTSIGCEGLDARDGENILIRDTPQEFARAVEQVLTDASLRDRLAGGARKTVEQTYSWEVIGGQMAADYISLLSRAGEQAAPRAAVASSAFGQRSAK